MIVLQGWRVDGVFCFKNEDKLLSSNNDNDSSEDLELEKRNPNSKLNESFGRKDDEDWMANLQKVNFLLVHSLMFSYNTRIQFIVFQCLDRKITKIYGNAVRIKMHLALYLYKKKGSEQNSSVRIRKRIFDYWSKDKSPAWDPTRGWQRYGEGSKRSANYSNLDIFF